MEQELIKLLLTDRYRLFLTFFLLCLFINPFYNIYSDMVNPVSDLQKVPLIKIQKDNQVAVYHPQKMIESVFKENRTDIRSGKITKVAEIIFRQSTKYGYDPLFILAIIKTESSFRNKAVSNQGARGLMQIVPATGIEIARKNNISWKGFETLHSPIDNIEMGTYYLSKLVERFDGNIVFALEAYNNGPTRIRKLINKGKKPNYRYTKKVFNNYKELIKTYRS